jgi:hypothetical protein
LLRKSHDHRKQYTRAALTRYTDAYGYDQHANRLDLARADAEIALRDYERDPEQYPNFAGWLAFAFEQIQQATIQIEQEQQDRRAQYEAWRAQMRAAHVEEARALENALLLLLESSDAGMAAWQELQRAVIAAEQAIYARVYQPEESHAWEAENAILRLRYQIEYAHSTYAGIQTEKGSLHPATLPMTTAQTETHH